MTHEPTNCTIMRHAGVFAGLGIGLVISNGLDVIGLGFGSPEPDWGRTLQALYWQGIAVVACWVAGKAWPEKVTP